MSEKRKDKRGRLLRNGETQDKTGEYRFSYYENGKKKNFRSWRLNSTDPLPEGKRFGLSLREKEEQYFESKRKNIDIVKGDISVRELVGIYVKSRSSGMIKKSTKRSYNTVVNFLAENEFGGRKIKNITTTSAMIWMSELQTKCKKHYGSIKSIKSVLHLSFRKAVQNGWLLKNPFDDFKVSEVIVNDSSKRGAISSEVEQKYLDFIKNHKHFSKYYECIYVLFNTGMRISEFCGLTTDDIDLEKRTININKQLQANGKLYIEKSAKTQSGARIIPMEDEVYECFKILLARRKENSANPSVDGVKNFVYINRAGAPTNSHNWENSFISIEKAYNRTHKDPIPHITPHVCRHTYCSKKAKARMNPVHLAYLMGHSTVDVTLGTYTHTRFEDAVDELRRIGDISEAV